jgi:tetratricopeptide (TPR) repeat protein
MTLAEERFGQLDSPSLTEEERTLLRCRVAAEFIHAGQYEAAREVLGAIQTFEQGGESAPLAEALTLQGLVLARLGDYDDSADVLRRAADMAEGLGARSDAGRALLTFLEEHGERHVFPPEEVYMAYQRADRLLGGAQDAETVTRLRACSRMVMRRLATVRMDDQNFSFYDAIQGLESRCIEQALAEASGSVVRAARLLGLKHQTFTSMLQARHQQLLPKRTPRKKRLKSIIKKGA